MLHKTKLLKKMNQQINQQEEQAVVHTRSGISELVVSVATICNKLVAENCGLCTMYCDRQVQYESVLEQYTTINPLDALFSQMDNSLEVQTTRQRLFDEESVVEQVASRDSADS